MNTKESYNQWASQYDTNDNKTRDLEAIAFRKMLQKLDFTTCLEIGAGTGKNTSWLAENGKTVTAIDLSEEMVEKAKQKIKSGNVEWKMADITHAWTFRSDLYDLVSFSLVLEHIENLGHIFSETARSLHKDGYVYIGELHPFKQYSGSKARFITGDIEQVVPCFTHNISEFTQTAKKYGLSIVEVNEFFDEDDRAQIPQILALLLKKI